MIRLAERAIFPSFPAFPFGQRESSCLGCHGREVHRESRVLPVAGVGASSMCSNRSPRAGFLPNWQGHRHEADRHPALVVDPHDEAAVLHGLDAVNARMRPVELRLRLRRAPLALFGPVGFRCERMITSGFLCFASPVDARRQGRVVARGRSDQSWRRALRVRPFRQPWRSHLERRARRFYSVPGHTSGAPRSAVATLGCRWLTSNCHRPT